MERKALSIGEVANAAGMSASAIRYYEDEGLLPPPARLNGRRRYDESVFLHLTAIRLAQESGFTVAEIKQLLESCSPEAKNESGGWKGLAAAKMQELDRTIARAKAMKRLLHQWLECECVSLEDCSLIARRSNP